MTGTQGLFIAIEGGDGSGKTGAVAFLARSLKAAGHDLETTREPGGTKEGLAIRQLLIEKSSLAWEPMAELLLINAARVQHVRAVIGPALAAGKIVVCDRFIGSTLAYQGAGQGLPEATILALHKIAVGDLWPDLTIVIDADPEEALERSRKRLRSASLQENRFEDLGLAFHRRVHEAFRRQAASDPLRYVLVDGNRPEALVQQSILRTVLEAIARLRPAGLATPASV